MLVTVGGSEAIDIALRTMVNPGDEVLIPQPSYVSYEPCAILALSLIHILQAGAAAAGIFEGSERFLYA